MFAIEMAKFYILLAELLTRKCKSSIKHLIAFYTGPCQTFYIGPAPCQNIQLFRYSLACSQLEPGDVCISLAHSDDKKDKSAHSEQQKNSSTGGSNQHQGPRPSQDGVNDSQEAPLGHRQATAYPSRMPPPIKTAKADT